LLSYLFALIPVELTYYSIIFLSFPLLILYYLVFTTAFILFVAMVSFAFLARKRTGNAVFLVIVMFATMFYIASSPLLEYILFH